jgi:hypothetical protein
VDDRELVVAMRLLQKTKITLKSLFALKPLDFFLHNRDVGRELENGVIVEVDSVVWFTFDKFHAFVFQRCSEFLKGLMEEPRK